jgi:hypothetical protein
MDNAIKVILEDAGWYENRKIDISDWKNQLENENFTIPNKVVEDFLCEYANLEYNFLLSSGKYGNIKIAIDEIVPYIELHTLREYENLIGEKMVPIGTVLFDIGYLYISHTGKFYMQTDGKLYLLGDSFFDCINTIKNQNDILRLV